jgi:DNA-binding YbaB/EbfC family protein
MFDALKNLGQLPQLMAKAKKFQEEVKTMQEQLGSRRLSADAGDGRVTATVNGRMELIEVRIDRDRMDLTNVAMLQDLTVAAVRAAQFKAAELVKDEMQRISAEVGIDPSMLPGGGAL